MAVAVMPIMTSNLQEGSSSPCASTSDPAVDTSPPKDVRFYCSEVPDFSEYFNSKKFSDVNLVVGNKKIQAHRSRLASVSPFLASVFAVDTSEVSTVILPEVPFAAVNILVNFMYTGFMRVSRRELRNVLEVASLLGIDYPIDIEETEIGVVRFKPTDAKRKAADSQFGGHTPNKKPRNEGPSVAIYEGSQSVDSCCQILTETSEDHQLLQTPETVTIADDINMREDMDVESITLAVNLDSSTEMIPNQSMEEEVVEEPPETALIAEPTHRASPRPRIKKTKTRSDLLNEMQNQSPMSAILISGDESNDASRDISSVHDPLLPNDSELAPADGEDQPQNAEEVPSKLPTLAVLAQKAVEETSEAPQPAMEEEMDVVDNIVLRVESEPEESPEKEKDGEEVEQPVVMADETEIAVEQPEVMVDETETAVEQPVVMADETEIAVEQPVVIADETETVVEQPVVIPDETENVVDEVGNGSMEVQEDHPQFVISDLEAPVEELGHVASSEYDRAAEDNEAQEDGNHDNKMENNDFVQIAPDE